MSRRDAEMVECDGSICGETDMAWHFISEYRDEEGAIWIPKSISEWRPSSSDEVVGTMFVPEWFAHREGLI